MACTVCDSRETRPVVSIPGVPVYCNVLWPSRREATHAAVGDIDLRFCESCGHFFNRSFDAGKTDYTQEYENSLHFSPRFNEYSEKLVERLVTTYDIRQKHVVDVGCGKGDFLRMICARGRNRGYGFDPSYDPDRTAIEPPAGISFFQEFFGPRHSDLPVDLLCCRHVLEHVERPTEFLEGIAGVLGRGQEPVIYFEVPNAMFTVRDLGIWDLIYEHCSYFTECSLERAFVLAGFEVCSLQTAFDGQYLQIEARLPRGGHKTEKPAEGIPPSLLSDVEDFNRKYVEKIDDWKADLQQWAGARLAVWGGGSKGVTFLNVMREASCLEYVVDVNPHKQGKFVPGTAQQVVAPEELRIKPPDRVIVMNPVYREEIRRSLEELGVEAELAEA